MPGLVVSIAVDEGQEVKVGETLAVIEAMKMENILRAERDGTISKIRVKPGDSVAVDAVIMEFAYRSFNLHKEGSPGADHHAGAAPFVFAIRAVGAEAFVIAALPYMPRARHRNGSRCRRSARNGLWLFAPSKRVLIWVWFALHAKRLRDADRSTGLAAGAGLLYSLSVVLLLIVATAFFPPPPGPTNANTTGALRLILLLSIVATLAGSSSYDLGWFAVVILMVLAFLPIVVAVAVTLWAATGASINEPTA